MREAITKMLRGLSFARQGEGVFRDIPAWRASALAKVARRSLPREGSSLVLLNTRYHGEPGEWTLEKLDGRYSLIFVFATGPFTSRSQSSVRRMKGRRARPRRAASAARKHRVR